MFSISEVLHIVSPPWPFGADNRQGTSKAFHAMAAVTCSRSCNSRALLRRRTPPTWSQWSSVMQVCIFWSCGPVPNKKKKQRLQLGLLDHMIYDIYIYTWGTLYTPLPFPIPKRSVLGIGSRILVPDVIYSRPVFVAYYMVFGVLIQTSLNR